MNKKKYCFAAVTCAMALCAGCASAPVPDTQIAASQAALNDALTAGASDLAPQPLQTARDKLAAANAAVAAKNNNEARRLAEEAEVDARLAAAHANTQRARMAVAEIQRGLDELRNQLANPANRPANPTPGVSP